MVYKPTIAFVRNLCAAIHMAPMKAIKGKAVKAMTKTGIAEVLAEAAEIKKSQATKALAALAEVAAAEVKKGKFTIPGVCMVKTRLKRICLFRQAFIQLSKAEKKVDRGPNDRREYYNKVGLTSL